MKRTVLEITLTFIIMSVVGIIINGLFAIAITLNFLTFDVVAYGIAMALVYLVYIWIYTQDSPQWLASSVSFTLLITIITSSSDEVAILSNYKLRYYCCYFIYFYITCQIAQCQGQEFLEEDKKNAKRHRRRRSQK